MLILLVVVGGVALVGVRNVRAKIARCRIGAAQEMAESLCCMVENYMSDHRMSEPPKDLRVLLEIDRNNNEPYLAGGERFLDDPWGSPYRLVCEDKRWRVVSNGPDGVVAEAHVVTGGGFWTAADWEVHAGRALCGGFEVPFH